MSTFEYNKSMLRYSIISVVMTVIAVSVLAKGLLYHDGAAFLLE